MAYVTKEMAERAREIHVFDYVNQNESHRFKRVGSSLRLREEDAFAVTEKGFYCHKSGVGGVIALDYLMKIHGIDFVSAVCRLLNENPLQKGDKIESKEKARSTKSNKLPVQKEPVNKKAELPPNIVIPPRNKDNYRVIAYLQNRGIDKNIILDCINRGVLYESATHHNAVFLGKDERGKTKFAAMRAVNGDFKRDADYSDKRYGFIIPPQNPESTAVALFESPIDCLSFKTLMIRGNIEIFDGTLLSLGGTSLLAFNHFLEQNPKTDYCLVCTDNDEYGNAVISKIPEISDISLGRSPPFFGKDWNETLVLALQEERKNSYDLKYAPDL